MDARTARALRARSMRWHTTPGSQGETLIRALETTPAVLVKQGHRRAVYRLDLPEGSAYLKYQHAGRWGWLKNLFRRSVGRREFDKATELHRRAVAAVRPLAVGEVTRAGLVSESLLLTEALPEALPLGQVVADYMPTLLPRQRWRYMKQLTEALALLCAQAHRQGVWHDDLHSGNVLVRGSAESGQPPTLWLIDLPGVRLGERLSWPQASSSLAMIAAEWLSQSTEIVPRSMLWRFWRTYLQARPELLIGDRRRLAGEIYQLAWRHARRNQGRREKRAWTTNRDFVHFRGRGYACWAVRESAALARHVVEQWSDAPLEMARRYGALYSVAVQSCADDEPLLTWTVYPSQRQARQAWKSTHALLARGIATRRPLVLFAKRAWLGGGQAAIMYASERSFSSRWPAEPPEVFGYKLGRLLGLLHQWHILGARLEDLHFEAHHQSAATDAPAAWRWQFVDPLVLHEVKHLKPAHAEYELALWCRALEQSEAREALRRGYAIIRG